MLRPRVIPCLLIHRGGLTKTRRFSEHRYVGDPLNAVRIFNEKEVDEIIVMDIDATVSNLDPNFTLIGQLAAECRMPLCYAGGIKSADVVERIIGLGVEKVAMASAVTSNSDLISEAAMRVGSQSIVVAMDVQLTGLLRRYEVVTHNATRRTGLDPVEFAVAAERAGAGEILINSVDNDGMMEGYDLDLVDKVHNATHLPVTVLGGAGSWADVQNLVSRFGTMGAAAGSLFVFKGKYRAVLIQYPRPDEKAALFASVN